MNILEQSFIKDFITMTKDAWLKGWHERNGGNLTYRLTKTEVRDISADLKTPGEWHSIGTSVPDLANDWFLVSGSGKHFRNMEKDQDTGFGIIELNDNGTSYRVRFGLNQNNVPTSELPTHLLNHQTKKNQDNAYRVIYHAHTTNLIALTYVLPLDESTFTQELWQSATECPVVFPEGVGIVEWMVPGNQNIGIHTAKKMATKNIVIWAHHGTFCAGKDFDDAFSLMDTVEKAAEIIVKIYSMTNTKRQTITKDQINEIAVAFNVSLTDFK